MTRRERLEARLERRRQWAASRDAKAAASFDAARKVADSIPLGQPILIGHHSERRARKDAERIRSGMSKGCEHADKAHEHASRADGLETQLDRSIYSDDPDAIEALEARIAELETKRERQKSWNAIYRRCKGDLAAFCAQLGLSDAARAKLEADRARWPFAGQPWKPVEGWALSNLGANIRRLRKRIEEVQARTERADAAEAAGGVLIERAPSVDWCSVTFEEKPERRILVALKAAGFRWGGGRWSGRTSALPAEVQALVEPGQ